MRRPFSTLGSATALVAAILLGACGDAGPDRSGPVTLSLAADSLIPIQRDTLDDGSVSVQCLLQLRAVLSGDSTGYAKLTGGRVDYTWWQTGNPAMSYDWTVESARQFFGDSIVRVGVPLVSQEHGFGQSAPGEPVRGTVQFNYTTSADDEQHTTDPFRFYCY